MFIGIIVWSFFLAMNVSIVIAYQKIRKKSKFSLLDILLIAITTDLFVHILGIIYSGFSEVLAWALITIPFIGVMSFLASGVIALISEYTGNTNPKYLEFIKR